MKMTLVVDTEDIKGMEAAHKMISDDCVRQYDVRAAETLHAEQAVSVRLQFIKALRGYMKRQMDAVESGTTQSLRTCAGCVEQSSIADAIYSGRMAPMICKNI